MSAVHLTAIDDAAWDSPWRHRRVGEKVLVSVGLLLTALVLPAFPTSPLVALIAATLTLGWARIPASVLWHAMLAPLVFIVIGALTVAVEIGAPVDATARAHWLIFSASTTSTARAFDVAAHALAGTLALMALATTTPLVDILTWLRGLRVPAPLLEIASLMYRLIFVILETLLAVRTAQELRLGFDRGRGAGRRRPWQATAATVGHTLTRSWHRAARLEEGLALRGEMDRLMTLPRPRAASPALLAVGVLLPLALIGAHLATAVAR